MTVEQAAELLQKTVQQLSIPYASHIQLLTAIQILLKAANEKE